MDQKLRRAGWEKMPRRVGGEIKKRRKMARAEKYQGKFLLIK